MMGQERGSAMQPDPQMIQMVMGHFLQMLQGAGGMGTPTMSNGNPQINAALGKQFVQQNAEPPPPTVMPRGAWDWTQGMVDSLRPLLRNRDMELHGIGPLKNGSSSWSGSLPMRAFARGGIVNRPTIGLLGEEGPEAVVPLGGQAQGSSPLGQFRAMQPQPNMQGTSNAGAIPWFLGAGQQAGAFGPHPPQAIMDATRQRIIADNAAQARSARLGLMGRTDVDPSTYGFQALMSDLQGQRNLQQGLSEADLKLRQQQMEFLQKLLFGEQGFQQASALQRSAPREGGGIKLGPVGFGW